MKTKFASPAERDMKFCRNSKLRAEDFGHEVQIIDAATNAVIIVLCIVGLVALSGLL